MEWRSSVRKSPKRSRKFFAILPTTLRIAESTSSECGLLNAKGYESPCYLNVSLDGG